MTDRSAAILRRTVAILMLFVAALVAMPGEAHAHAGTDEAETVGATLPGEVAADPVTHPGPGPSDHAHDTVAAPLALVGPIGHPGVEADHQPGLDPPSAGRWRPERPPRVTLGA
jgi:hypothetical protein